MKKTRAKTKNPFRTRQKRSIPLNVNLKQLKANNPGKIREFLDSQQKSKDIVETHANLEEVSLI